MMTKIYFDFIDYSDEASMRRGVTTNEEAPNILFSPCHTRQRGKICNLHVPSSMVAYQSRTHTLHLFIAYRMTKDSALQLGQTGLGSKCDVDFIIISFLFCLS